MQIQQCPTNDVLIQWPNDTHACPLSQTLPTTQGAESLEKEA